jgi:tyrosyl-tRNA synthetase
MDIVDLLKLASHATVAQLLARADFKQRFEQQKEISLLEFLYPLLQAYDSVYLKADIEFGGTDQKFNLLMGRQLQEVFGQRPQVIIMMPLLEGTDGIQKMSKSLNNYIGITEPANEIFGKIMSISDELMWRYYELLTDIEIDEIKSRHPKEAKLDLAQLIVSQYYTEKISQTVRTEFEDIFSKGRLPKDAPVYKIASDEINLIRIILENGLVKSGNEARRLLRQGAISFNGRKIADEKINFKENGILKIGKHKFLHIVKP